MTDSTFGFAATGARAKELVMRSRPSRLGMLIFGAIMVVIVVVALMLLSRGKRSVGEAPRADEALGLSETVAHRAAPASATAVGSAALAASGAHADAVALPKFAADALASLKAADEGLAKRSDSLDQRLSLVEAGVVDVKRQLEEEKSAREAAQEAMKQATRRKAAVRPAAPPVPPSPPAELLSVDTWDGRASISMKDGDRLLFVNEGDAVGKGVVLHADRQGQRVRLSTVGDAGAAPAETN